MSQFFENHRPYLAQILSGLHSQAVEDGIKFLGEAKRFAPNEYEITPKGTPFYFLGIAAFLSNDFQTATFLFDAAVSEDLKHNPYKDDTPALLTMQLNETNENQAALPIVRTVASKIRVTISEYNGRTGSQSLTLADLRNHFLRRFIAEKHRPHLRTITTTLISYFFEWEYRARLIELSEAGSREPFFMHLFRGCLLFESLLKENPSRRPSNNTLGRVIEELSAELGIAAALDVRESSFDAIVSSLTSGQPINATIQCTGKTRNTLGHNLAWIVGSLDASRYNLLAENIAISCLHAISCLYR